MIYALYLNGAVTTFGKAKNNGDLRLSYQALITWLDLIYWDYRQFD